MRRRDAPVRAREHRRDYDRSRQRSLRPPGRRLRAAVVVAAAVAIALALAACGTNGSPAPSLPGSPLDGVVIHVDSTGLGNVTGFTLRLAGGATVVLSLGTLENATQFAPGHLAEHETTGLPVRAWFVASGGIPIVYRLEDVPAASSAPLAPSSSP